MSNVKNVKNVKCQMPKISMSNMSNVKCKLSKMSNVRCQKCQMSNAKLLFRANFGSSDCLSAFTMLQHCGVAKPASSAPSSSNASTSGAAKPAVGSSAPVDIRSEPAASSSSENRRSPGAIGGAEKPAAQLLCDLEGATWMQMLPVLQDIEQEEVAQKLLEDVPKLQKWKGMSKPSNEVRDAMMKLGSRWEVSQYIQRKKRPPAEVAQELDERMRRKARELLTNRGLKPLPVETSPSVAEPRDWLVLQNPARRNRRAVLQNLHTVLRSLAQCCKTCTQPYGE